MGTPFQLKKTNSKQTVNLILTHRLNKKFFWKVGIRKVMQLTVHSMTDLPTPLPEPRAVFLAYTVSDKLGLIILNHTGLITWGISCHFTFSSRVELLTRKAKESHLVIQNSDHFGFSGGVTCAQMGTRIVN